MNLVLKSEFYYLSCGIFIKNQSQSQNKADLGSTKNFNFSKALSQSKGIYTSCHGVIK